MKALDIISQIRSVMPKLTDLFSDKLSITSLTFAAGTVTATTASAHGLSTGNFVFINGALSPNPITITRVGNIATAITTNVHDLTQDFHETVTIRGADQSEYNGEKTLLSVVDKNTFTFTVTGDPATPATGTIFLDELITDQYNGRHEITVTDTDEFTYTITGTPSTPASGTIEVKFGDRISGAATVEKALQSYTNQTTGDLYLFVVLEDARTNKNRDILNDASYRFEIGQSYRQEIIQAFSVFAFIPSTGSISGRDARDQAEDIRVFLVKSLLGVQFDAGFNEVLKYGVTYLGDSLFAYDNAYIIHQFNFEVIFNLNREDIVANDDNRAWRTFIINYERDADEIVKKQDTGELP